EIINADGTISEMCGNGLRAVALFLNQHGPTPGKTQFLLETLVGLHQAEILGEESIRVSMGVPQIGRRGAEGEMLEVAGKDLRFFEVSMGNPHAIFFAGEGAAGSNPFSHVSDVPLSVWGPEVERNPRFPRRTNVEFVEPGAKPGSFRVAVWERGAGITEACGSGACAVAVAAWITKRMPLEATECLVELPGGEVRIGWSGRASDPVTLTGPAKEVYTGEIEE
ncbi:MAG: diaminopimelate epimerase, partial [Bdellovibrionota bacterium]